MDAPAALDEIETYYDEVPRAGSRVEQIGPFTLFVSTGPFTYYARPDRDDPAISADDVRVVLDRQAELGVPRSLEWVDDLHPELAATVTMAGLAVFRAPLMRYLPASVVTAPPPEVTVRMVPPDDPGLPAVQAAIGVGFGHPGTGAGSAGTADRDDAERTAGTDHAAVRARIAEGSFRLAGAFTPAGAVGGGAHSPRRLVTEITGVATLPAFRRHGVAAAVTTTLVQDALEHGTRIVFLSAGSNDIARVYQRSGFHRIGTACIASAPEK